MTQKYKKLSLENRRHIINNYNNNKKISEIANILDLRNSTIRSVIKLYLQEGRIASKSRGGSRNKKINDEIKNKIRDIVDENCLITLKSISRIINEEFGINLSTTTIFNTLKAFHYTFKAVSLSPVKMNDITTIESRYNYANKFLTCLVEYDENKIFFVDEVGFNISMRVKNGRSLIGTTPISCIPTIRSKNLSICCAMSKISMKYKSVQQVPYNTASFLGYINKFFQYLEEKDFKNCVIIMDNARIHKNIKIKEIIEANNHKLLFLPPYSPYLNPIENMFSKWKTYVKNKVPVNEEELLRYIDEGIETITEKNCQGYYRNMIRYIQKSLSKEEIN